MADKLKEIPAKILEWWNKFTTRQKSIIIGAAAVVIFAFAIIMYVMSKPQYVRLITCETTSQASEIIDTLDSAGIAHKESNDGLKIDVESSQQSAANLALGSAGYVPDALDLNDYLGGSMSTTATDKERLYNSYLEKYITQTIEAQSAVKSAKVHLSFPKDNGTLAASTFSFAFSTRIACVATMLSIFKSASLFSSMARRSSFPFNSPADCSSYSLLRSFKRSRCSVSTFRAACAVPNSCFACVSIFSLIFRMFCREYLNLAIYLTPDLRTALPASVRSLQR